MNGDTQSIQAVQNLWRHVLALREGGLSEPLAFYEVNRLLFLKLLQESAGLPQSSGWPALLAQPAPIRLEYYRRLLRELAASPQALIAAAYACGDTRLRDGARLAALLGAVRDLEWTALRAGGLAAWFESLLEKYAADSQEGWRVFTPPMLVDALVGLLQPQPGDTVLDPAAGAGCFLVAADAYIQAVIADDTLEKNTASAPPESRLLGLESDAELRALAAMRLTLQQMPHAKLQDVSPATIAADVLCGNLLVGCAGLADNPEHDAQDEVELLAAELEHEAQSLRRALSLLKTGGRAALIVSDELLSMDTLGLNAARQELLDSCKLHTLLRLPDGIFYGRPLPASVLFFTRNGPTERVWMYDMRSGLPCFDSRHTPFSPRYLTAFEAVFGDDPAGESPRENETANERWRVFDRKELAANNNTLDTIWLNDERAEPGDMPGWIGEELHDLENLLKVSSPRK